MSQTPYPPHYIGIDFGTSKCVTTYYNEQRQDADVINNSEGEWQTPSVVYYTPNGEPIVGQIALNILTDAEATGNECERVVLSAKRNIARRMRYMFEPYPTPLRVATDIFRKLRRDLIELEFHFPVTHAVVTVPACYDMIQREGIRQAALAAGFEHIELVDEPTAAAIAYARESYIAQNHRGSATLPTLGDVFLVYDLGAGTFDLSILRRKRGKTLNTTQYEVALKPSGNLFGGDDLDRALYYSLDRIAQERLGRPLSTSNELDSRFLLQCRKAKVSLGRLPATTISAYLRNPSIRFEYGMEQGQFYDLIRPLLLNTIEPVQRLLDRAVKEGIGRSGEGFPLDNIILIGGSSKIPLIPQILHDQFNIKPFEWANQDRAVALGAAYMAYELFRSDNDPVYSLPPVIAARVKVEVPPLSPPPQVPGTNTAEPVTLTHDRTPITESTLEYGIHVAFNVPSGRSVLYPRVGNRLAQPIELNLTANRLYRVRLEYDPNSQIFKDQLTEVGNLITETKLPPPSTQDSVDDAPPLSIAEPPPIAFEDAEDICAELKATLIELATSLRKAGLEEISVRELDSLAESVNDPCVVAVVGRVKAGKSTFVNALLGEDLAKVGAVETTATINRFAYGKPNPERPVLCVRRDGTREPVSRAFLDSLQGNESEVLERAQDIEYLEYRLENPFLARVVLVDTPGMGAAVAEHNQRVQSFLGMEKDYAEQAYERSRQAGNGADAVIFVIGQVPRITDQSFLEAFTETLYPGTRALNAVGVMAKVDERPEVFARRRELCRKIQEQMPDKLNVVLPVSAALERYLDSVTTEQLRTLVQQVRQIEADEDVSEHSTLGFLLSTEGKWKTYEDPDCPVSPETRASLCADLPWSTFTMMARTIAQHPTDNLIEIEAELREVAGFAPLKQILEQRFVERGHLLRAFRIVQQALEILDRIYRRGIPSLETRVKVQLEKLQRFRDFLKKVNVPGNDIGMEVVRHELEEFIGESSAKIAQAPKITEFLGKTECRLTWLLHALQDDHSDLDALQLIEGELLENPEAFAPDELAELRTVLGLYGRTLEARLTSTPPTPQAVSARMATWAKITRQGMVSARRQSIANAITQRYGIILDEILRTPSEKK